MSTKKFRSEYPILVRVHGGEWLRQGGYQFVPSAFRPNARRYRVVYRFRPYRTMNLKPAYVAPHFRRPGGE